VVAVVAAPAERVVLGALVAGLREVEVLDEPAVFVAAL
jgi:hypothetical protein